MTEWPKAPQVGVGCIVVRAGRLLLVRNHAGYWSTPGGHLDFGETPAECAARETEEETGVRISDAEFVAITNDVLEEGGKHYVTIWMRGEPDDAEAVIGDTDEIAELGWYDPAALPSPLHLYFQSLLSARSLPPRPPNLPFPLPVPRVRVVPYQEDWPRMFESEREALATLLGPAVERIHHIGSTSVPGLGAKPIIDILVESADLVRIDAATPLLEERGYDARGEYGIPGRRYFSRRGGPESDVHLHAFECGSEHVERQLRFRDYLRSHPAEAARYDALKAKLAQAHPHDRRSYQLGKAAFIRKIEERGRPY
jgi:GrpB-like predicted nucleotidyltransferase (UPF0157 family)/ADP-ribose pyrophosphatase YjhB (NUDIX family)